jgi:hypothetical protein
VSTDMPGEAFFVGHPDDVLSPKRPVPVLGTATVNDRRFTGSPGFAGAALLSRSTGRLLGILREAEDP